MATSIKIYCAGYSNDSNLLFTRTISIQNILNFTVQFHIGHSIINIGTYIDISDLTSSCSRCRFSPFRFILTWWHFYIHMYVYCFSIRTVLFKGEIQMHVWKDISSHNHIQPGKKFRWENLLLEIETFKIYYVSVHLFPYFVRNVMLLTKWHAIARSTFNIKRLTIIL